MEQMSIISTDKFRLHLHADRPFSYSVFFESYKSWPVEAKERPGYAVDGVCQFAGTNFRGWNE